jgi:hypothetical protein
MLGPMHGATRCGAKTRGTVRRQTTHAAATPLMSAMSKASSANNNSPQDHLGVELTKTGVLSRAPRWGRDSPHDEERSQDKDSGARQAL